MQTEDGDVVIATNADPVLFSVWTVVRKDQQELDEGAHASTAYGRTEARKLASEMARETRGAVFFLDRATGAWTNLTR
jgi:hypothetical protein